MIFDFNVPYTVAGYEVGGHIPASLWVRGKGVMAHAVNIPLSLIKAIMHIAMSTFMGVAHVFTLCKYNFFGKAFYYNFRDSLRSLASSSISVIGVLAPINAFDWIHHILFPNNR